MRERLGQALLCVQGIVSPDHERLEIVFRTKLGQAHADGRRLLAVTHGGSHVLDSAAGDGQGAVHKRTEELVASDADKRVIGPQMLLDRVGGRAQEPVAGDMAAAIVDLFEWSEAR